MKKTNDQPKEELIYGYKGFDKDLKCQNMQYEIGKDFEMEKDKKLKCCPDNPSIQGGLHFCENPLDVLNYYPLKNGNRYAEVIGSGESDKKPEGDSKIAVTNLKICAEITFAGLIKGAVKFIMERSKVVKEGNSSTSKDNSHSATAGYNSHSATAGDNSHSATAGKYSNSATAGYNSHSATAGDNSISAALGPKSTAKGHVNNILVLSEWEQDKNYDWIPIDVQSIRIDGEIIKADTFYKLEKGKIIEAN